MPSYREIQIANSVKQPQMVDQLLNKAPVVADMETQTASHALHNIYEKTVAVTGAAIVDADEALPTMHMTTELDQIDLSIVGGQVEVGLDKAKLYGGKNAYFASKQPTLFKKSGQDLEKSLLYNSMRAYAITNSNVIDMGGATASIQNSIIAVTYSPGEIMGLTSPDGFGDGAMMEVIPINGGNNYKDSNGVLVYGNAYKMYTGIQLANPNYVSAIVNIQLTGTTTIPTEEDIETMLEMAEADENTRIYCHPMVKRLVLDKYKAAKVRMVSSETEMNRALTAWDKARIITSRNFSLKGEALVT